MLVDTHTHLYWEEYQSDLDQVVENANEAGIDTIVTIGVDVVSSQKAAKFDHPKLKVYSSIGIHPHEAHHYTDQNQLTLDLLELEKIYQSNPSKVIAVGECGLDFFFSGNADYLPTDISIEELQSLQRQLLQSQTDLAKKLNLPLIIHCRNGSDEKTQDAWEEIFNIIGDHYGILHCYSGNENVTKKALETKFLFSFAANITYPKNQYLRDAATQLPLERIVMETDCPFLSPQKNRGQRNEPANVRHVAELIAELKSTPIEEVINQTSSNFQLLTTAS